MPIFRHMSGSLKSTFNNSYFQHIFTAKSKYISLIYSDLLRGHTHLLLILYLIHNRESYDFSQKSNRGQIKRNNLRVI